MKQWRKLLLTALLAWLLIFLYLLSHFLDKGSEALGLKNIPQSPSHPEIRRLTSIQGGRGHLTTPGSSQAPDTPQGSTQNEGDLQGGGGEEEEEVVRHHRGRQRQEAKWRQQQRQRRSTIRTAGAMMPHNPCGATVGAGAQPGKAGYSSLPKAVVRRLWQGLASSQLLSPKLQRARLNYLSENKHQVAFQARRKHNPGSVSSLLCQVQREAHPQTVDGSQQPFAGLGWSKVVPTRPLVPPAPGSKFNTCAVVMSSGAMLKSSLGAEIDSHDAVLRLNAAPTKGYEKDVGTKTTFRVINSQILARPRHHFNTSSLYQNTTLLVWDPAPYSLDLLKWYENPDFDLFTPYVKRRLHRPDQPFYVLHPAYIWSLWDIIQSNSQENIQPNPPSSGFIGVLLMMALCREVHVYEYIPSVRQTDLCHYYEPFYDSACTLGAYHPLLYEKLLVQRMNTGPCDDLATKGRVTLPGFAAVDCPAAGAATNTATRSTPRSRGRVKEV